MKKFLLIILIFQLVFSAGAQIKNFNLRFNSGQVQLTSNQKEVIDSLAGKLMDGERLTIYPLTYDSIWNRLAFNKNAKVQAVEIANYAVTKGFELLGTPTNFPSGYEGLSVSVNLKFHLSEDLVNMLDNQNGPSYSLKNHYPTKPSQYFTIDPNKDTLIIGKEGTKLFFEAGSLMTTKEVEVELKEFYTLDDYLKSDLTTSSDGKMILSGGVIYLNAVQNDADKQTVKVNQAKGIDVTFSMGNDNPDMQIFIQDKRSPDELNWVLPAKKTVTEDWQMTETKLDPDGNIISQTVYRSREEWERHLRNDSIAEQNRIKMENRKKIFDFGLINCDAFSKDPMLAYSITADKNTTADYFLVFRDIRGVMKGNVSNNLVTFGQVPSARPATLIAASFIGDQAYFFKCAITAANQQKPEIILKPVEESFLTQELSLLR
jgi:hypothetical protein